ncbi:AI-2E family transporter [Halococcoides cellulosivorans]|nr:AI-2E family transporter [Halococcoides cellulosivorans]
MAVPDLDGPDLLWIVLGLLLAVVLATVLEAFLGTFVFALFVYYATRPVYRRLRRRIRSPTLSAGLALVLLALPVVTLIGYTIAMAYQEFDKFVSTTDAAAIGPLIDRAEHLEQFEGLFDLVQDPGSLVSDPNVVGFLGDILDGAIQYVGLLGSIAIQLFIMLAVAFYLLRDGPGFGRWMRSFGDDRGVFDAFASAVDGSLQRIFYGALLNAVLTAIIGSIVFSVLASLGPPGVKIPYPALLGVLAGLASLIPIVGMKLVYVPMTAYLVVRAIDVGSGYGYVVVVFVVSLVIVDTIPDFIVRPYVSRGDLHVGLVMFAYIIGPLLFGWYGIFLGPIVLVVLVHFLRVVVPAYADRSGPTPGSVDPVYLDDP